MSTMRKPVRQPKPKIGRGEESPSEPHPAPTSSPAPLLPGPRPDGPQAQSPPHEDSAVSRIAPGKFESIEQAVCGIDPELSPDDVCTTICRFEALEKWFSELKDVYKESLIRWIKANREITIGTVRYYVAPDKTTKATDAAKTLQSLLELLGVEATGQCLSANAWKPGATRKLLEEAGAADVFDTLFETTTKDNLKEGKPKPGSEADLVLQRIDTRFLR